MKTLDYAKSKLGKYKMILNILLLVIIVVFTRCSMLPPRRHDTLYVSNFCPTMKHCGDQTHVMCMFYNRVQPVGPRCTNYISFKMTPQMVDQILDTVNEIRSRVANGQETGKDEQLLPRGYGMMRMEWDSQLATFAQILANQCLGGRSDECRATNKFPNPSQTISIVQFQHPDWLYLSRNTTDRGFNMEKVSFAIDRFFKTSYALKDTVSRDMIMSCPSLKELSDRRPKYYLNLVRGTASHIGCGISAYTKASNDIGVKKKYNRMEIICNLSDAPQAGQPVYMTEPPIPGTGFTEHCGCPRGFRESAGCLCEEDFGYSGLPLPPPPPRRENAYGLPSSYQPRYEQDRFLGTPSNSFPDYYPSKYDKELLPDAPSHSLSEYYPSKYDKESLPAAPSHSLPEYYPSKYDKEPLPVAPSHSLPEYYPLKYEKEPLPVPPLHEPIRPFYHPKYESERLPPVLPTPASPHHRPPADTFLHPKYEEQRIPEPPSHPDTFYHPKYEHDRFGFGEKRYHIAPPSEYGSPEPWSKQQSWSSYPEKWALRMPQPGSGRGKLGQAKTLKKPPARTKYLTRPIPQKRLRTPKPTKLVQRPMPRLKIVPKKPPNVWQTKQQNVKTAGARTVTKPVTEKCCDLKNICNSDVVLLPVLSVGKEGLSNYLKNKNFYSRRIDNESLELSKASNTIHTSEEHSKENALVKKDTSVARYDDYKKLYDKNYIKKNLKTIKSDLYDGDIMTEVKDDQALKNIDKIIDYNVPQKKYETKVMTVLDTLEKEVNKANLKGLEKQRFDIKMRKIYKAGLTKKKPVVEKHPNTIDHLIKELKGDGNNDVILKKKATDDAVPTKVLKENSKSTSFKKNLSTKTKYLAPKTKPKDFKVVENLIDQIDAKRTMAREFYDATRKLDDTFDDLGLDNTYEPHYDEFDESEYTNILPESRNQETLVKYYDREDQLNEYDYQNESHEPKFIDDETIAYRTRDDLNKRNKHDEQDINNSIEFSKAKSPFSAASRRDENIENFRRKLQQNRKRPIRPMIQRDDLKTIAAKKITDYKISF